MRQPPDRVAFAASGRVLDEVVLPDTLASGKRMSFGVASTAPRGRSVALAPASPKRLRRRGRLQRTGRRTDTRSRRVRAAKEKAPGAERTRFGPARNGLAFDI